MNFRNSKVSLKDLQLQQRSLNTLDESCDDDDQVQISKPVNARKQSEVDNGRNLTPKEKLLRNKLKKADEEAARVSQIARVNYEERILRDLSRKDSTIHLNNSTVIADEQYR